MIWLAIDIVQSPYLQEKTKLSTEKPNLNTYDTLNFESFTSCLIPTQQIIEDP